jgi:hypothetical protein
MATDTRVFIGFDLTASSNNYFVLNDTTRGLLDSSFVLGGDVLVDVTEYVQSVSINRGKSREQNTFTAGNASVVLHNDSRIFDPFYTSSPYFSQILPRKEIVIQTNGIRQFSGYIDDWDLTYELGGKSYASVSAIDGFLQLSSTQLAPFTNTVQLSGERVVAIINRPEVAWPVALRDIDTGQSTLQADVISDNPNALGYLQLVEQSEIGSLFMAKDGKLTFRDRTNYPPTIDTLIFADDEQANSIGYNNIEVVYGSENLSNRVVVTREGGTPQQADSLESQSIYGVQSLSLDGLLLNSDADALTFADYLVGRNDNPELRFANVSVQLEGKDIEQVSKILAAEINDVYKVVFTPNNLGDPIEQYGIVTGINHSIGIDRHTVSFEFGSVQDFVLILDDPIYGRLGGSLPVYDSATTSYDEPLVRYDGTDDFGYILAF